MAKSEIHMAQAGELSGFIRLQGAAPGQTPRITALYLTISACSARGRTGAEAGKRNIPARVCLRLFQVQVITAKLRHRPPQFTQCWPFDTHVYRKQSRHVEMKAGAQSAKLCPPLTARGHATRQAASAFSPLAISAPLLTSGSAAVAAQTCCTPIRDVGPVAEASRRQGDMFSARVLPNRLNASCRSLALSSRRNSTASGLWMMTCAGRHHADAMHWK
ncbi:hypothetical protein BDW02DRAFT_615493 [Decorospora gaudefroyi]|uniref:Uncharacterized protein n=1 Tax=Decorospora gaudefroyi TaxID=184978 RepID=A0A6A5KSJ6_9PLEO|nr:hypothetical protein BDW02DRAFT_615493 [Decorospora gaudefroyi]